MQPHRRPYSKSKIALAGPILAALGVFVVGAYFSTQLLSNDPLQPRPQILQVIAGVRVIQGDVRRRTENSLVWQAIAPGEKIYFGDQIYAGSASYSKILLDGTVNPVFIEPNSLISFNRSRRADISRNFVLDLQYGSVFAAFEKPARLTVQGKKEPFNIDGEGVEFRLQKQTPEHAVAIHLFKGKLQTTGSIEPNAIELLQPAPRRTLFLKPNEKLKFAWRGNSPSYRVEFASDPTFSNVLFSKTDSATQTLELESTLFESGPVFWRVLAPGTEARSSTNIFFWYKEEAPTLVFPAPLQHFVNTMAKQASKPKDKGIDFLWLADSLRDSFTLQIAHDREFIKLVSENKSLKKHQRVDLPSGEYFWRVRSHSAELENSEWSETRSLTISSDPTKPQLAAIPEPPILESIASKFSNLTNKKELLEVGHTFTLAWSESPQTKSIDSVSASWYEVEWGADSAFTLSKTFRVPAQQKTIRVKNPGTYSARVRKISETGHPVSNYSNVQTAVYKIEKAPKKNSGDKIGAVTKAKPTNHHKPSKDKPSNRKLASLVVPKKSSAPNGNPATVNGSSPVPAVKLAEPALLEPSRGTALVGEDNAKPNPVAFKWQTVTQADSYELQLAEDADFEKGVVTEKTSKASYTFRKELPEGHLFWRVRARRGQTVSEWSRVFDLTVLYQ